MTRLPTQPQVKGVGQSLASVFRHLNVDYPIHNHWKIILKESPVNQAQFCYLYVLLDTLAQSVLFVKIMELSYLLCTFLPPQKQMT